MLQTASSPDWQDITWRPFFEQLQVPPWHCISYSTPLMVVDVLHPPGCPG